jgi:hypothetical protein
MGTSAVTPYLWETYETVFTAAVTMMVMMSEVERLMTVLGEINIRMRAMVLNDTTVARMVAVSEAMKMMRPLMRVVAEDNMMVVIVIVVVMKVTEGMMAVKPNTMRVIVMSFTRITAKFVAEMNNRAVK